MKSLLLDGLGEVPKTRPTFARPISLPSWSVIHGGCRWVSSRELQEESAPFWRLSWFASSLEVTWQEDGRRRQIRQESNLINLIPPNVKVKRILQESSVHLYLTIRMSAFCNLTAPWFHPLGPSETTLLRRLIKEQIERQSPKMPETIATSAFLGLLFASLPSECWSAGPSDARIRAAVQRIQQDPSISLSNQILAKEAGLSLGRFVRLFQAQVGVSPQRLIRDCRLDLASEALRHGQGIKSVAKTYGWADRSRFSVAFRQRFGRPPASWLRSVES